jgi:VWFA-related protein
MRPLRVVFCALCVISSAQDVRIAGQQRAEPLPASEARPVQDVPAQDSVSVFRAAINFVRVDVIVTDRTGQTVDDLVAEDFEVLEDDAMQHIEQFRLVRVDQAQRPSDEPVGEIRNRDDLEREAAYDDVRLFVVFFDDYHTRQLNAVSVRRHLQEFVQKQIGPKDLVAFMYPLSPLDTVSFSRDQTAMSSTIERFIGRKFDYEPLNDFEQNYANYPTEQVEAIRNQVVMGALRGLATHLGGVGDGRKAIVYVGEGLTTSLPSSMRNRDAQFANSARARPDGVFEDSQSFFAYSEVLQRLRDVIDAANRTNTSFYTLDPRGLAVNEFQIDEIASTDVDRRTLQQTQDILRILAEDTDGRAIVGRNDLAKGLAQMVKDSSAYYLMGYNSTAAPMDGKFHSIKVRLSGRARKRGLRVRARRGYLAPTMEDIRRLTAPPTPSLPMPMEAALSSLSARQGAHEVVREWLGASRGRSAGKVAVTYLWEALPRLPGTRGEAPSQVSIVATNSSGSLVFRGRVPATTDLIVAAISAGSVSFESAAGPLHLRVSVESAAGAVLDTKVMEWQVPSLVDGLSTPRVYRVRTVREVRAALSDGTILPVASREFSRTERVVVRFEWYGESPPAAALLDRMGKRMMEVAVHADAAPLFHLDLPLGVLAAGDYLIEISAGVFREIVALKVGT